ncbi:MAG: peptidylprolyl isomerase [Planctomycetes bacterium]|nr:peptidylprolyl isomerase [Planctomycetota bacterium]
MKRRLVLVGFSLALVLLLASPLRAKEDADADLAARAAILRIELRRGPVADLAPWLKPDADPALRRQAIRALGRIGEPAKDALIQLLEAESEPELPLVLWSAGLAMSKDLAPAIREHLEGDDVEVVEAAAAALGWCDARGVLEDLGPLLLVTHPAVRVAALTGLARGGDESALERVVAKLADPVPEVRDAAWHAAWRLASRRVQAAKAASAEWQGDEALVGQLLRRHGADASRRVDLARVLAGLVPPSARLADRADDALLQHLLAPRPGDDRGDQEVLWRLLGPRAGATVDALVDKYLLSPNAVTRGQAYDVLSTSKRLDRDVVVRAAVAREADPRLYAELFKIDLLQHDRMWLLDAASAPHVGEAEDLAVREAPTIVSAWALGSALGEYSAESAERGEHPAASWGLVFDHASQRAASTKAADVERRPLLRPWLASFLRSEKLRAERPYVLAFAVSATEAIHDDAVDAALLDLASVLAGQEAPHDELERGVVTALVARAGASEGEAQAAFRKALHPFALSAHSAFARLAAREALTKAGEEMLADNGPVNDWRGLPRPSESLEAWGLTGSKPMLDEGEILQIADWITRVQPKAVLETTAGTITVEVDAEAAPVHAVAFVLNVHAGLYKDTRWHRVVPGFVIQGGDPTGTGAGNAGWTLPDEITDISYGRGVLGMPKSVKDDGGCQLFFMLGDYKPLDERYTAYGRVVGSMEAVDTIRIGDHITACRLEISDR